MKKKVMCIGIISILLLLSTGATAITTKSNTNSDNFYVDDDWLGLEDGTEVTVRGNPYVIGVDAFAKIQDAIDATNGASITILDGEYNEDLEIKDKTVHLTGENEKYPLITGTLKLEESDQPRIIGLSFYYEDDEEDYETDCCILLLSSSGCKIINNKIETVNCECGIAIGSILPLKPSEGNEITDNIINSNIDDYDDRNNPSISLGLGSKSNKITDNEITRSGIGVELTYGALDNDVVNNVFTHCFTSIYVEKIENPLVPTPETENNKIYENHIYITEEETTSDYTGIKISANNNIVHDNVIDVVTEYNEASSYGIRVSPGNDNEVYKNTITNAEVGIKIYTEYAFLLKEDTKRNEIYKNEISNCVNGLALSGRGVQENNIWGNTVEYNEYGIYVYNSGDGSAQNNVIYWNNFIDNEIYNAYDTTAENKNVYRSDRQTEGNYWSDWDGEGAYVIEPGNTLDPYPLEKPWEGGGKSKTKPVNHDLIQSLTTRFPVIANLLHFLQKF